MNKLLKLTVGMLLGIPTVTFAQTKKGEETYQRYVLEGTINQLSAPATMYLEHYKDHVSVKDSVVLLDGHYHFEGKYDPDEKTYLALSLSGKGWHDLRKIWEIYLEPKRMEINSADSFYTVQYVNSPVNEDLMRMADSVYHLYLRYGQKDTAAYNHGQMALLMNFLRRHPSSPISLMIVRENGLYWQDDVKVEPYFDLLSPELKTSPAGKAYAQKIADEKKVRVGQVLTDFMLPDTAGVPVALHSFRGKYVLVDFWASWCGPCRAENPTIIAAYNKYKDSGFTVLGVSLDYPGARNAWLKAIHDDHLTWTQVSDLKGWNSEPVKLFAISFVPRNFLIGPDGKVIGQNLRGDALGKKLKELLEKQ